MILYREDDYNAMSLRAASIIARELKSNPALTMCLATGETPEQTYRILGNMCKAGDANFSKAATFNLDEYVGLDYGANSYRTYMKNLLFDHVNIRPENTHIPRGNSPDTALECLRYDRLLDSCQSRDILLTGIGMNGHIGFNEPCSALDGRTHIARLSQGTRKANARFFDSIDQVPELAITMGFSDIFHFAKIVLIANGRKKAPIIRELVNSQKITTQNPSLLLKLHRDVTVIIDKEAAELL